MKILEIPVYSDEPEMLAWVEALNLAAACLSAPPLPSAVGSETPKKAPAKPILPLQPSKLTTAEQLQGHEERLLRLRRELGENGSRKTEQGLSHRLLKEFVQNEHLLLYEVGVFIFVLSPNHHSIKSSLI